MEELFGLDALYGPPRVRLRDIDRVMRSSASRDLGLDDDEEALLDRDSDEDEDENCEDCKDDHD